MCPDDMDALQRALDLAEADLREREAVALQGEPTPEELRAFAAERDKIAAERNGLEDGYDERARVRDTAAFGRDVRGSRRDRAARDRESPDLDALDRFVSGSDRDLAAGDRADALDDRHRSATSRKAATVARQRAADDRDAAANTAGELQREIDGLREALKTRVQIGQAEGLLMSRYGLDPDGAFRLLVKLSGETHIKLRDVAARLVADAVGQAKVDVDDRGETTN
jgi:hypothetical protein